MMTLEGQRPLLAHDGVGREVVTADGAVLASAREPAVTALSGLVRAADVAARIWMRVQGWIKPEREGVTFFGARMKCDIRDFVQRRIFFFGIFEHNLSYYILARLRPGDGFIDVGANVGYFSLLASKIAGPAGQVLSIEASPDTCALLRCNVARNHCGNVEVVNLAATSEPCTVEIVRGDRKNIGTNSVKRRSEEGAGTVRGMPLSAILGPLAPRANLIKIDVEGSEAPILEDVLLHLDRFPAKLTVVAEVTPGSADFIDRFRRAGFAVFGLPNNYTIGYFLIRSLLGRERESALTVALPVEGYSPAFTDYIFERA